MIEEITVHLVVSDCTPTLLWEIPPVYILTKLPWEHLQQQMLPFRSPITTARGVPESWRSR